MLRGRRFRGGEIASEDAPERTRGADIAGRKNVETTEAAEQHVVRAPRADSRQLEEQPPRTLVVEVFELTLEIIEREPRQRLQRARLGSRQPRGA